MPERGHLQRLLPLIEGLSARGRAVHVLTDGRFAREVARSGGRFLDLFASLPLDAADATSRPVPSRYVSFAGAYAEALTTRVAELGPGLIVYDTFAVIAPIVGRRLGIPYVNVCAGHAAEPVRTVAALRLDPRVATSPECLAAVQRLRDAHGMPTASPFSYVEAFSPFLNVYCEPPQFLDDADRAAFEPLAFFGALAPERHRVDLAEPLFPAAQGRRRIYVSFGTVIWRYFEALACDALAVLSDVCADLGADVVMSLGGHALEAAARARLGHPNARIESYVDQWAVLRNADVFVTHHGLNSTHEAIFNEVPMASYPFFGDQTALARRCQDLGLALPLASVPQTPLEPERVRETLDRLAADRDAFATRLAEAHAWERAVIAGRSAVFDRILSLI
jgi:MGT family glycosyltransferase